MEKTRYILTVVLVLAAAFVASNLQSSDSPSGMAGTFVRTSQGSFEPVTPGYGFFGYQEQHTAYSGLNELTCTGSCLCEGRRYSVVRRSITLPNGGIAYAAPTNVYHEPFAFAGSCGAGQGDPDCSCVCPNDAHNPLGGVEYRVLPYANTCQSVKH